MSFLAGRGNGWIEVKGTAASVTEGVTTTAAVSTATNVPAAKVETAATVVLSVLNEAVDAATGNKRTTVEVRCPPGVNEVMTWALAASWPQARRVDTGRRAAVDKAAQEGSIAAGVDG